MSYQQNDLIPLPMPKNWLVESILVTILCCLPFGIVGIINAAKVESLYHSGQFEESEAASRAAAKWTKIGFWVGLGVLILYLAFLGIVFFMQGAFS